MTTTDIPPAPTRVLRRSRTGRVGAGVAGGLGEYFGLDPVLFRVLFATSAFFGGAGVIAYLIAWAAIPEEGTGRAPIDGAIAELRRRRVPVWLVVTLAGLLVWLLGFSWWAPGPFIPVLAVIIVLIVAFGRRQLRTAAPAVSLTKDEPQPGWTGDLRGWVDESRAAGRRRRSRALPVKVATLLALVATMIVLGVVDGVTGIAIPVYFWTALGIVGLGLLVGFAMRRTPWSLTGLLVPITIGTIAFAGTHASLHDGTGQRTWKPTTTPASAYRLAFGDGTLDLTQLPTQTTARTVDITLAAGRVRIVALRSMSLRVQADIRFGRFAVDGIERSSGAGISAGEGHGSGTQPQLTVNVHLGEGEVLLEHR